MQTFIDMLRDIKPVALGKKAAITHPLMASTIESKVSSVGYTEAEYFDICVKLGMHSVLCYPNESTERRAQTLHQARCAIADLVYRDIRYGLQELRGDVWRVSDHELRQNMETTISNIEARIEIR